MPKSNFAAAAGRLAKLRSKAPKNSTKVQATEGQTALNPKQQGHSFKNAQTFKMKNKKQALE